MSKKKSIPEIIELLNQTFKRTSRNISSDLLSILTILNEELATGEPGEEPIDIYQLYSQILASCPNILALLDQLVDKEKNIVSKEMIREFQDPIIMGLIEVYCKIYNLSIEFNENIYGYANDELNRLENLAESDPEFSTLDIYRTMAKNYPIPSLELKKTMYQKYINRELTGDDILGYHIRLILKLANKKANNNSELVDLIQEGAAGLAIALNKFEPDRGVTFITFSHFWIRHCIENASQNSEIIRLPRQLRHDISCLEKLLSEVDGAISYEGISKKLGWPIEKVQNVYHGYLTKTISLEQSITSLRTGEGKGLTLLDTIADPYDGIHDDIHHLIASDIKKMANAAKLTKYQLLVVLYVNGFMSSNKKPLTYEEVGAIFGTSRQNISELYEKALEKLKTSFTTAYMVSDLLNPLRAFQQTEMLRKLKITPHEKFDLYSFFEEYKKEEIDIVFNSMPQNEINRYYECIKSYENNVRRRKFIVNFLMSLYDKLVTKYGVKNLVQSQSKMEYTLNTFQCKKNETGNKRPGIYGLFLYYSKETVDIALRYVSQEGHEALQKRFGPALMEDIKNFGNIYSKKTQQKTVNTYTKIQIILESLEKGEMLYLGTGIYSYFKGISTCMIDQALEKLEPNEKDLLHKRFGPDLRKPYPEIELTILSESELKKLTVIKTKIFSFLKKIISEELSYKAHVTIYGFFSKIGFNKEEVDSVFERLSDDEKRIIKYIYDQSLEKPVGIKANIRALSETDFLLFARTIEKMKIELEKAREDVILRDKEPDHIELTALQYNSITEYINKLPKDNTPDCKLTGIVRDRMIVYLYLGIGDTPTFPVSFISNLFELSNEEVRDIIKHTLVEYKEEIQTCNQEVALLIGQISEINDRLTNRTTPVIGPDIRLVREK